MEEKKFYPAKDISKMIGIKPNTLYKLARDGKVKHIKVGGSVRFCVEDFEENSEA